VDTNAAKRLFRERFGEAPTLFAWAPGRVNLIGEHTDYNDGFVMPVAIDKGVTLACAPAKERSQLVSEQKGDSECFDVRLLRPGCLEGWGAYPAGVAWAIQGAGFENLPNLNAAVVSDLPIGSGLSSSAALEMAFLVAWNELAGLALDAKEGALLAQKAENQFVGVSCGVMDQMASALGREGNALFIDTRSLEVKFAPIPQDFRIVVCDTGMSRELTGSAYNERRMQCEEAARVLGVSKLRDADLPNLEKSRQKMSEIAFKRARHVISENKRCQDMFDALKSDDRRAISKLMREGHESLRADFEVSTKELDAMAQAAWNAPGCVGARMTGAGFGGACVAIVEASQEERFIENVAADFLRVTRRESACFSCNAAQGASAWKPSR
jgi:galactokinase